jgi:hypothetical protein
MKYIVYADNRSFTECETLQGAIEWQKKIKGSTIYEPSKCAMASLPEIVVSLMHANRGAMVTQRAVEVDPAGNTYELAWSDLAKRAAWVAGIDLDDYDITYFAS